MPDDRTLTISSTGRLTPDEVARRSFATTRRGFDPAAVRSFLDAVARELGALAEREEELREALADAEHRAANPVLDEATLTASLGQETARVLRSAHEAVSELLARAEADAARIRGEAQETAEQLQARAEQAAEDRSSQAESAASEVRRRAQEEVTAKLEGVRLETEAMVSQARAECRAMVQEAQELRSRILADLTKRRRILHSQIEQLRAGRERLAQAIGDTRGAVNRIVDDVFKAEDAARLAAEEAGRHAAAQLESERDDLPVVEQPAGQSTEKAVEEQAFSVVHHNGEPHDSIGALDTPSAAGSSQGSSLGSSPSSGAVTVLGPSAISDEDESTRKRAVEELFARLRAEREASDEQDAGDPSPTQVDTFGDDEVEGVRVLGRLSPEDGGAKTVQGAPSDPAAQAAQSADVEDDPEAEGSGPARDPILLRRDELLGPVAADLARKLKRALQDDQNDILDRLRSKGAWSDDVLPPEEEHTQRYVEAGMSQLGEAASAGGEFARGGGVADAVARDEDHVRAGVQTAASELATSIVVPLRRRLSDGGLRLSDDEAALTDHVGSAFREWKGARVERLAGDQAIAAFSVGTLAATADNGFVRWVVDDDGVECPDCDDNALAGEIGVGEKFPTGHAHPPAHPGCRCIVAAVNA